jgi:hypothetical protein
MDADAVRFRVRVFFPGRDNYNGYLSYTPDGPKLVDDENRCIVDEQGNITLSMHKPSIANTFITISEDDRFELSAVSRIRKFAIESEKNQDLYPPSTKKWAMNLSQEGTDVFISIQKICDDSRYLLSCVDCKDRKLIRLHPIKEYEATILTMESDWDHERRIFASPVSKELSLSDLLQAPAPSWLALAKLVEGVDVPNLQRYETVKETLTQLVPKNYPDYIRDELMIFLAWTTGAKIPKEDPLDFLEDVDNKFKSGLLKGLVFGHIHCLIQGIEPPKYVRILALANRELLESNMGPITEEFELDNWRETWYKLMEIFPDRRSRVIDLAQSFTSKQEIHTSIPISRKEAKNSKDAWLDRYLLIRSNFTMRGYVQDKRIGLTKLVYIGGAHRWPHKHLQYTARLGNLGQKPPYIQFMLMPKTGAERLLRLKQNIAQIDWSASRMNFNLYDRNNDNWKCNVSHFTRSFQGKRTVKHLNKEFNLKGTNDVTTLSEEDSKILDLLSGGLYIHALEKGNYDDILQTNKGHLKERIASYLETGLIQLQYVPTIHGLTSICLEIRGNPKQLYSIARSSLKHLPSATALVSENEKLCVVMARVPAEQAYEILVNIPNRVTEYGISVKGYRVFAYAGYLHDLYQRLRNPDGTWDDDVTGLLSQISS